MQSYYFNEHSLIGQELSAELMKKSCHPFGFIKDVVEKIASYYNIYEVFEVELIDKEFSHGI
jgi:hypothetical protein